MSPFVKNILKLSSGSLVAQMIGLLTMPIVTRYFDPTAFGLLGVFTAIVGVAGVNASLRYEFAIMLPDKDEEAANVFVLSAAILVMFSLVSLLIVLLAKEPILTMLGVEPLGNLLYFVPLMIFISGGLRILQKWYSRKKAFGGVARSLILQRGAAQGTMIGAGLLGGGSSYLIIAQIVGQSVSTVFLLAGIIMRDGQLFVGKICFLEMKRLAAKFVNFPKFDFWSALLNATSSHMPIFIFGYFFSPQMIGYYVLGRQVLNLPIMFVGQAVGQVFFQKAVESKQHGELAHTVEEVFSKLVSYGMFPFLLLMLTGNDIFAFAFGNQWAEAGVYVQYLSIWMFFVFMASSLRTLFSVLERQKAGMFWDLGMLIVRVIVLVVGGMLFNERITILVFGVVGAVGVLINNYMVLYYSNVSLKASSLTILKTFGKSLPFLLAVAVYGHWASSDKGIFLVLFLFIVTCVYYFLVVKTDCTLKKYEI